MTSPHDEPAAPASLPEGAVYRALLLRLVDLPMDVGRASYLRAEDPLCRRSIFDGITAAERAEAVALAVGDPVGDRAVGCVVGMAVGDAVGAPLEFLPARDDPDADGPGFDRATVTWRGANNAFELARGQWTDDAAMGLCLADTLLLRRRYDGSDFRARLWNWWFRGYNNAFRLDPSRALSVGLGRNVADALFALPAGAAPPPRYEAVTQDSGNGPLIRLAAIPALFHRDPDAAARWGAASCLATHPGPIAQAATAFLAWLLARAIGRGGAAVDAMAFLDAAATEYAARIAPEADDGARALRALLVGDHPHDSPERCWNWRSTHLEVEATLRRRGDRYNGYPVLREYFGAYCLDGLAVALHAVAHSASFDEAVAACANHLGDADSTAAIAGQIAGALYGHRAIDPRLLADLARWDGGEVALRGALLYALGAPLVR
ncbi:MAG: ADP-ribosylglycohydrolase family protein [Polyangiales bacterium]